MDKQMEEFLKVDDLGELPNEVFKQYMEMIDNLPRRGFRLYGEFFEATTDEDITSKMANLVKMAAFIVSRKIESTDNEKHPDDEMLKVINGLAMLAMFDKLAQAFAVGFTAGIAFAIDNMLKADEEEK